MKEIPAATHDPTPAHVRRIQTSPVSAAIDVHFTSGDSLQGDISAASGCDEAAVDAYLNRNPKCD